MTTEERRQRSEVRGGEGSVRLEERESPSGSVGGSAGEEPHGRAVLGPGRRSQVPAETRQRVSVDEAAAGRRDGTVVTRGELKHTRTRRTAAERQRRPLRNERRSGETPPRKRETTTEGENPQHHNNTTS